VSVFPGSQTMACLNREHTVTRETLHFLPWKGVCWMSGKRRRQMKCRESDNLIVVVKRGNARGAKEVTHGRA
jgi:hypothetical protein